jgi:hypothetical protein
MDFSSSSTNWIFAANSGSEMKSDSPSANINQHQNTYGTMSFGTSAKGGSDVNPFTSGNTTTTTSGGSSGSGSSGSGCGTATATGGASSTTGGGSGYPWGPWGSGRPWGGQGPSGSFPSGGPYVKRDDACTDDPPNSQSQLAAELQRRQNMLIAHGVMAALVFVIFLPLGAIAVRLLSFPGLVMFHAAFQIFAYLFYLVAFGLGVYICTNLGYVSLMALYHFDPQLTARSFTKLIR